ncbi:hypothetical protein AB1Y20_013351 [Prymnesium parvum]|uniref:peptidylprolyl isomerase n=1 Tax=Prymnesium parvum TaxID=97485 RepID=A0AB34IKD2_PRYPA
MALGAVGAALALLFASASAQAVDHAMRLQQIIGSAKIAANEKRYDLALQKLRALEDGVAQWREHVHRAIAEAAEAEAPAHAAEESEPPEPSIDFEVNVTFTPPKCPRKSMEGSVMKVHYVGQLVKTKKTFASSFHTGSMPYRFTLGSDEVLGAWNEGLVGMCEGERRRLMVPWTMGYGAKGDKGVPPYSDLRYDFELVELNNPKIPKAKKSKSEL